MGHDELLSGEPSSVACVQTEGRQIDQEVDVASPKGGSDLGQQLRGLRVAGGPFDAFGHTRCECRHCGSHLKGVARNGLVTGVCGTCGSSEVTPVGDPRGPASATWSWSSMGLA